MPYAPAHIQNFRTNLRAAVDFDPRPLDDIAAAVGYSRAEFQRILDGAQFPHTPSLTAIASVLFGIPRRSLLFDHLTRDRISELVRNRPVYNAPLPNPAQKGSGAKPRSLHTNMEETNMPIEMTSTCRKVQRTKPTLRRTILRFSQRHALAILTLGLLLILVLLLSGCATARYKDFRYSRYFYDVEADVDYSHCSIDPDTGLTTTTTLRIGYGAESNTDPLIEAVKAGAKLGAAAATSAP